MTKFKNDVSPEVLEKSLNNREHKINWSSLKLFQFDGESKPTALIGKSLKGNMRVRIAFYPPKEKTDGKDRPFALFYKLRNGVMHLDEGYYLSDQECDQFASYFEVKH